MSIKTDNKKLLLMTWSLIFCTLLLSVGILSTNAQFQPNTDTNDRKQIFIEPNNIKSYVSMSTLPQKYSDYYNATFLFDKLVNSYSYLSVKGLNSGFNVELKEPLQNPICSVQAIVYYPSLNTPYQFTLTNASGSLTDAGKLSSTNQEIKMQDCISNVTKIGMKFSPTNASYYTVLSELNLYTEKDIINPPPLECPDGTHPEGDKCVPNNPNPPPPNGNQTISNSTVIIDITKSDIKIHANDSNIYFPNMTMPYPNMTIPDVNTTIPQQTTELKHNPDDSSDEEEEENEREEQEEEENNNEDDDN